jgi:hypothetical protein
MVRLAALVEWHCAAWCRLTRLERRTQSRLAPLAQPLVQQTARAALEVAESLLQ